MQLVRGFLRVLLLAVLGTVIGVVLVEVVVRLAPGMMPSSVQMLNHAFEAEVSWPRSTAADEYLGYHLRANQDLVEELEGHVIRSQLRPLDHSEIGIRDLGMPSEPVDGIAVGDSFTYCSTVPPERCWLRLVAERTGRRFVNLGVPGYSALQETRMLARYGVNLHPRLILWGIFLNDFKEDVRFQRWLSKGKGDFLDWVRNQRVNPWVDFFERQSLVYRVARRAFIARGRDVHRWSGRDGDLRFSGAGWWRDIVDIDEHDPAWRLMRDAVVEQKRLAAEAGAQLVVLLFPFKEQAYWHVVKDFAARPERCDPDRPYRMVAELCRAEGLRVLDLTPQFRERAQARDVLYLRDDAHWNEAGNALAGSVIATFLNQAGLGRN